jgi:hypothetical protein
MSTDVNLLFIPLNFGIWLCYYASWIFIYQMTIITGYLFPAKSRLLLGKEIEKSGIVLV